MFKQARQIRQVGSGEADGFTRLTIRPSILYRQSNRQIHKLILQHHQPVAGSESAIDARKTRKPSIEAGIRRNAISYST